MFNSTVKYFQFVSLIAASYWSVVKFDKTSIKYWVEACSQAGLGQSIGAMVAV